MYSEDPHGQAGRPDVLVRCSYDPGLVIRLGDRQFVDGHETVFSVEARADGLHATVRNVTVSIWDGADDLAAFLQELVDDFRGWPGTRTWLNNQLTLDADFHSGGHVELLWKLSPWPSQQATWEVNVTTWIESGQQLTTLAADVRAFLTRP